MIRPAEDCCNLPICLFHSISCEFLLTIISTCFRGIFIPYLQWSNPCILICPVVTSTSMQNRVLAIADISDLMISAKSEPAILCCHVNLVLLMNPCIIWRYSIRMFCSSYYDLYIDALVCNCRLL